MESEAKIQHSCIMWFDKEFPQYRGLLYHNYLNPPNAVTGRILKGLGLKKGVPDLTFALPINGKHGLYIEMKTAKGTLQKEQIKYRDLLQKVGYNWELCRSLEQFQTIIKNYLA
jgi:hypothetical protein